MRKNKENHKIQKVNTACTFTWSAAITILVSLVRKGIFINIVNIYIYNKLVLNDFTIKGNHLKSV